MRVRAILTGVLVVAVAATAAPPDNAPYAFFSHEPSLAKNSKGELGAVSLRPNVEQLVYVYVHNPEPNAVKVNVLLAGSSRAGDEIAQTTAPVDVPAKSTVRVALAGVAKPAPAGKPAAATPGVPVANDQKLLLRVTKTVDAAAAAAKAEDHELFPVSIKKPSVGTEFEVTAKYERGDLKVTVELKKAGQVAYTAAPIKVALDLLPDANPALKPDSLAQGTFEAELPAEAGAKTVLAAEGIAFAPAGGDAFFALSIDGYDRAAVFVFREGTTDPDPIKKDPKYAAKMFLRLAAEATADGKKSWDVLRDADAMVRQGRPVRVSLGPVAAVGPATLSAGGGAAKPTVLRKFPSARREEIFLKPGGDNDALVFTPVVADWAVELSTAAVTGVRVFEAVAGAESVGRELIVDRSPPTVVTLTPPPMKERLVGKEVTVSAKCTAGDSKVTKVFFYLGESPAADGKPAPGSKVREGVPSKDKDTWTAKLRLPDAKGDAQIGVLVVNGVGLTGRKVEEIEVREPEVPKKAEEKKKPTTGSIVGSVVSGSVVQRKKAIELRDETGKTVVKTGETDDDGKYKFEELAPGTYVLTSTGYLGATGRTVVTVVASEKPTEAKPVNIKR